jgi:hypothetical protein
MPDVNLVWLDRVCDLDHGCSPMPDEWALREPDVRLYREPDVGDYRLLCVGCHDVIWSYPYAMERRHIAAALAAADNHVCGQVAS